MSVATTANTVYLAIRDNPEAIAAVRSEFATLALSIAVDPNASNQITSATVNGQSFTARTQMTQSERLNLLRRVIWSLDNGGIISNTQITTFQSWRPF